METFNNLNITSNKELSQKVKELGIYNFKDLALFVKKLPYRRVSNRDNNSLVLTEECGTCSTKHAFLAQVATENHFSVTLHLGIYKMSEQNTKGVGSILQQYNLTYIPEAHCYLKLDNQIIDCTKESSNDNPFQDSLLYEEIITPKQIGKYKIELHKMFLKKWLVEHDVTYNLEHLWRIRELCIGSIK